MNILVTGGAGFVGSNLALMLKSQYPQYHLIVFDNLKRRGSELNLPDLKEAGIQFVHGDIRNKEDFAELPPCDLILEASAEPSVLSGIQSGPDYVLNTNLVGTLHCLEFARKHQAQMIFLSTSRVYSVEALCHIPLLETNSRFTVDPSHEIIGLSERGIAETFSTQGYRSLYGATKLASEMFIEEYAQFYGLQAIVNRCGVLTGPRQMGKVDQGVVILWLSRHLWKQKLSYIGYGGKGKQVRDFLHIADLYRLIDQQIHHFDIFKGDTFNIGGGEEVSVSLQELTTLCEQITGNTIQIDSVAETRSADVPIYLSDTSKIFERCAWKPQITVEDTLSDCYQWMLHNEAILKKTLEA